MDKITAETLKQDYGKVFAGPAGGRVLADLARLGFLGNTTFTPGDSHAMAFKEGARSVVLHIFDALDILNIPKWEKLWQKKTK